MAVNLHIMANKAHKTRSNVLVKRGSLPAQRRKIVDNKSLDALMRKAEKAGLIIHGTKKRGKK
jgi:hypothetical protein